MILPHLNIKVQSTRQAVSKVLMYAKVTLINNNCLQQARLEYNPKIVRL